MGHLCILPRRYLNFVDDASTWMKTKEISHNILSRLAVQVSASALTHAGWMLCFSAKNVIIKCSAIALHFISTGIFALITARGDARPLIGLHVGWLGDQREEEYPESTRRTLPRCAASAVERLCSLISIYLRNLYAHNLFYALQLFVDSIAKHECAKRMCSR